MSCSLAHARAELAQRKGKGLIYQHAMQLPSQGITWQFFLQIGKQLYIRVHV